MITQKDKIWNGLSQFRTTGYPTHISPFPCVDLFLWLLFLPLSFSWDFVVATVTERPHYPLLSPGPNGQCCQLRVKISSSSNSITRGEMLCAKSCQTGSCVVTVESGEKVGWEIQCLVQMPRVLSGGYRRPGVEVVNATKHDSGSQPGYPLEPPANL